MFLLGALFGVTLQALFKDNSARAFAVAKWLLWTALAIIMIGFWGPLAIVFSVLLAFSVVCGLYFAYKGNQLGTFFATSLGLITVLLCTVAELTLASPY